MTRQKRPYMQFSKKIVVAVIVCVTLLSLIAIVLCWHGNDLVSLTNVVRTYIQFSMVVFASYSCNSVAEKLITNNQLDKIFSSSVKKDDQSEG